MKLWAALSVSLVCGVAQAQSREVYVDWSGVSDLAIETCKLRGLETLMVQSLIEEHFAVVGRPSPSGITIGITTGPRSFELHGNIAGASLSDWVDIPRPCDSSIALTLTQKAVHIARELDAKVDRPATTPDTTRTSATPPDESRPSPAPPRASWSGSKRPFELGGMVALPGSSQTLAGGFIRYNIQTGPVQLALGPDVVFWSRRDVTILEPAIAAGIHYGSALGSGAWNVGVEAAGILHHFSGAGASGNQLDGRVGVPLGIGFAHNTIVVTVMPYTRLDRLEHFLNGARLYTSEHWGVAARLGVGLGNP